MSHSEPFSTLLSLTFSFPLGTESLGVPPPEFGPPLSPLFPFIPPCLFPPTAVSASLLPHPRSCLSDVLDAAAAPPGVRVGCREVTSRAPSCRGSLPWPSTPDSSCLGIRFPFWLEAWARLSQGSRWPPTRPAPERELWFPVHLLSQDLGWTADGAGREKAP